MVWAGSQNLNACFERPSTTTSSLDAPVRVLGGVRPMMTVTWRSPCRVCPQRCSSPPRRGDPVQSAVSGGEVGGGSHHGITDGVPRHPQIRRDPGNGETVDNNHLHRQRDRVAGEFPSPRGDRTDVVTPDPRAPTTPTSRSTSDPQPPTTNCEEPPGDLHFDVGLVGAERSLEAGSLPVGEVLLPRAKDVADPIQRITSASVGFRGRRSGPGTEPRQSRRWRV